MVHNLLHQKTPCQYTIYIFDHTNNKLEKSLTLLIRSCVMLIVFMFEGNILGMGE